MTNLRASNVVLGDGDSLPDTAPARLERAVREPMVVMPVAVDGEATAQYVVATSGGRSPYVASLDPVACRCPDFEHRASRCKHLYRVAEEVDRNLTPAPGEPMTEANERFGNQMDALASELGAVEEELQHLRDRRETLHDLLSTADTAANGDSADLGVPEPL